MKIFLTGGGGFIGRNIFEQLSHQYEILAPKHSELELTDTHAVYQYLEAHPVDVVVHAANLGGKRETQYFVDIPKTNLKIFFNLIRAKKFFGRMITLGSGSEYGREVPIPKAREIDFGKCVPSDDYSFYKYVCAQYAEQVDYVTHLRLFSVFGKYEDSGIRFISKSILQALKEGPIVINQNRIYDYLYVDDFVKILDAILRGNPTSKFLNVGRGLGVDLKTIAEAIIGQTGRQVPVEILQEGYGDEYTCNIDLLKKEIGDFTFDPIESSILKLVSYYR